MIHVLPSTCKDHEGDGKLIGRYKLKGSRQAGTENITAFEARSGLYVFLSLFKKGQAMWKAIHGDSGAVASPENLATWRAQMMTDAADRELGSMESRYLSVPDMSKSSSIMLAFKMYNNEEEFRTASCKPVNHTCVHDIPRFYQSHSPWSPVAFRCAPGNCPAVVGDLYATATDWEPSKFALTHGLSYLRSITPPQSTEMRTEGRGPSQDWRGTVGLMFRLKLSNSDEAE